MVFFLLIAAATLVAALAELNGGHDAMENLSNAALKAAEGAVPLALGLIGVMALFLGLMKVAEEAGLVRATARLLAPLMRRLFPQVPAAHPAMGAMIMNVAANLLGLGNAATPFGIRAMEHLERLNRHKGFASDAQALFLALNTASVTILPTSVIALRAATGSTNPSAVIAPTLAATLISAVVAVLAARLLAPLFPLPAPAIDANDDTAANDNDEESGEPLPPPPPWAPWLALAFLVAIIPVMAFQGAALGHWIVPALLVGLLGYGLIRQVRIYECFVDGAREGFSIAVRIIPYLVAILVAIAMLRQSGALDLILGPLARFTAPWGIPAEALTMAGMRSLSGSGSFGLLASYMNDPAIGPDSPSGILLGTIYGSSETTFYVIAVYFGAVGIRRMRHALAAGLIADVAGLLAAVAACALLIS
nr:nucleoside recognition domain-containing protein [Magnetospirillum sulfuroxidans]